MFIHSWVTWTSKRWFTGRFWFTLADILLVVQVEVQAYVVNRLVIGEYCFSSCFVYFGWQCACSSGWRPSMRMNRSQKNSISRSPHSRIYKNRNISKSCVDEDVDMMGSNKCNLLNKTWGATTSLMSILWALPPLIVGSSYFITLSTFTLALLQTKGGIAHNICFFGGVT